jgi:hypothetical protein
MSATFDIGEYNGPSSSPTISTLGSIATSGHQYGVVDCNWKSEDTADTTNVATDYTSNPIQAGQNSYTKSQFFRFSGSFNSISDLIVYQSSGTLGTGLTLIGTTAESYTTNATTTLSGTNMDTTSSGSPIGPLNMSTTSPISGTFASTLTSGAAGYSELFISQLQTTTSASPGNTSSIQFTIQYNES